MNDAETARIFGAIRVVDDHLGQIEHHIFRQLLQHRLMLGAHRRTGVDLYEPHLQIGVNHEVIAYKLEAIFPIFDHILHRFGGALDLVFYLFVDNFIENVLVRILRAKFILQMVAEFVHGPYIFLIFLLFFRFFLTEFFDQAVVGQMGEIGFVGGVVIQKSKPDVALVIYPHSQRIPICDEHPLSDVEFLTRNYERILYIFL